MRSATGWSGIEALSGIPGRVGATPIQNVGAYGQDVSQTVGAVRVLDRADGRGPHPRGRGLRLRLPHEQVQGRCRRWVVLSVTLRLSTAPTGVVRYAELARDARRGGRRAGVGRGDPGGVLALRGRKGMVLDDSDPDTWSAGSFFTNPIVDDAVALRIPEGCPRYPSAFGTKLSAAWLIEHAGIARGFALGRCRGGRDLGQAHARADQPWRGDRRRHPGPGPRRPGRRASPLRDRAGRRADRWSASPSDAAQRLLRPGEVRGCATGPRRAVPPCARRPR